MFDGRVVTEDTLLVANAGAFGSSPKTPMENKGDVLDKRSEYEDDRFENGADSEGPATVHV